MKNTLTYKEFIGSAYFNASDRLFHGKLEGINDLVSFEGNSVEKLETAFQEAVHDYLYLCQEAKKEPLKPCKGSFNVRVPPEIHRKAVEKARIEGISLNQFIKQLLTRELSS